MDKQVHVLVNFYPITMMSWKCAIRSKPLGLRRNRNITQSSTRMIKKMKSVEAFTLQGSLIVDTAHSPDFVVIVGTETILVHRDLLGASSHYFHCLFESGMMEVQTASIEVVDVSAKAVKTVIAFMYGKAISIELGEVMDYMDIIEMWQLLELKNKLEDYLFNNIDEDNCIMWYCMANRYMLAKVAAKSKQLMLSVRSSILFNSLYFPLLEFSVLMDILRKGNRLVTECSWGVRHNACMDWILTDESARQCHYMDMLKYLGLTECPRGFIIVALNVYMNTSGKETSLERYKSLLSELPMQTNLKIGKDDHAMAVLIGGQYPHQQTKMATVSFNLKSAHIVHVTDVNTLPSASGFKSNINNGYCYTPYGMFACGHWDTKQSDILKCLLFDIPSLNYIHLPDFPVPVRKVRVVCVNYKVHILYIDANTCRTRYLDIENPAQWSRCAPRPNACSLPVVCSIGAKIYCLDMTPCSRYITALHCYDTRDGTWTKCQQPPELSQFYSAHTPNVVATDSDILVLYPHLYFLKYDCNLNKWVTGQYHEIKCRMVRDGFILQSVSHPAYRPQIKYTIFRGYTVYLGGCLVTFSHQQSRIELYTWVNCLERLVKDVVEISARAGVQNVNVTQNIRETLPLLSLYQF